MHFDDLAMEKIFLSVCMAVGPSETFGAAQQTIDSLRRQIGPSIELVVKTFGDHLRAEIEEGCRDVAHMSLRLLTGPDDGIYDAFNICAHAARGEYILYLGCGDVLADAFVALDVAKWATNLDMPPVIYGCVLIAQEDRQITAIFNNSTFHGKRRRLPWRNPCHSQGLVYRNTWLTPRPFRLDVGPLADLVHTYTHQVFAIAKWMPRPVSIFVMGGVSNQRSRKALRARMRGVLENCNNFHFSGLWKPLAAAVCHAEYLLRN